MEADKVEEGGKEKGESEKKAEKEEGKGIDAGAEHNLVQKTEKDVLGEIFGRDEEEAFFERKWIKGWAWWVN